MTNSLRGVKKVVLLLMLCKICALSQRVKNGHIQNGSNHTIHSFDNSYLLVDNNKQRDKIFLENTPRHYARTERDDLIEHKLQKQSPVYISGKRPYLREIAAASSRVQKSIPRYFLTQHQEIIKPKESMSGPGKTAVRLQNTRDSNDDTHEVSFRENEVEVVTSAANDYFLVNRETRGEILNLNEILSPSSENHRHVPYREYLLKRLSTNVRSGIKSPNAKEAIPRDAKNSFGKQVVENILGDIDGVDFDTAAQGLNQRSAVHNPQQISSIVINAQDEKQERFVKPYEAVRIGKTLQDNHSNQLRKYKAKPYQSLRRNPPALHTNDKGIRDSFTKPAKELESNYDIREIEIKTLAPPVVRDYKGSEDKVLETGDGVEDNGDNVSGVFKMLRSSPEGRVLISKILQSLNSSQGASQNDKERIHVVEKVNVRNLTKHPDRPAEEKVKVSVGQEALVLEPSKTASKSGIAISELRLGSVQINKVGDSGTWNSSLKNITNGTVVESVVTGGVITTETSTREARTVDDGIEVQLLGHFGDKLRLKKESVKPSESPSLALQKENSDASGRSAAMVILGLAGVVAFALLVICVSAAITKQRNKAKAKESGDDHKPKNTSNAAGQVMTYFGSFMRSEPLRKKDVSACKRASRSVGNRKRSTSAANGKRSRSAINRKRRQAEIKRQDRIVADHRSPRHGNNIRVEGDGIDDLTCNKESTRLGATSSTESEMSIPEPKETSSAESDISDDDSDCKYPNISMLLRLSPTVENSCDIVSEDDKLIVQKWSEDTLKIASPEKVTRTDRSPPQRDKEENATKRNAHDIRSRKMVCIAAENTFKKSTSTKVRDADQMDYKIPPEEDEFFTVPPRYFPSLPTISSESCPSTRRQCKIPIAKRIENRCELSKVRTATDR